MLLEDLLDKFEQIQGRTSIHGLLTMYPCALRGPARTAEIPGRLRRIALYKGLLPLRHFAAILLRQKA